MSYPTLQLDVDSHEYDLLYYAAASSAFLGGLTCEVGVRAGGGSELILKASTLCRPSRPHIAIDPWGNLPYTIRHERIGYDDAMRRQCMSQLYAIAERELVDLCVLPWKDTDFFERCASGVPLYLQQFPSVTMWNAYSFVHLDGVHNLDAVMSEVQFFAPRTVPGGWIVCDDVRDYDHDVIDAFLLSSDFVRDDWRYRPERQNISKAAYRKVSQSDNVVCRRCKHPKWMHNGTQGQCTKEQEQPTYTRCGRVGDFPLTSEGV